MTGNGIALSTSEENSLQQVEAERSQNKVEVEGRGGDDLYEESDDSMDSSDSSDDGEDMGNASEAPEHTHECELEGQSEVARTATNEELSVLENSPQLMAHPVMPPMCWCVL